MKTHGSVVPECRKCGQRTWVRLRFRTTQSGAKQVFWKCVACDCTAENLGPSIKHDVVNAWISLGRLPESFWTEGEDADYRVERCFVCGEFGTELHHFAPKALTEYLGDVEKWPTAFLCAEHHRIWHCICTPWMRRGDPLAEEILTKYYDRVGP